MSRFPPPAGAGASGGPPPKIPFAKPWLNWSDQVKTLASRGLVIADLGAAESFLSHVNYYRFSGYCVPFEQARHVFAPGTTFEDVRAAYDFDFTLRDLITEAVELVEVDARTAVAYHFGQHYGAFGHTDPTRFDTGFWHQNWLDKLRDEATRSNEQFVTHFKHTYQEYPDLPVWMVTEVMSFGSLSLMYKGMLRNDQAAIANRYGLHSTVFQSWLHHLVYIRNTCAHHARLWDRRWQIRPTAPRHAAWAVVQQPHNDTLFATLLLLRYMLARCPSIAPFDAEWKARVEAHLAMPPAVANPLGRMGLTPNWTAHPLWA